MDDWTYIKILRQKVKKKIPTKETVEGLRKILNILHKYRQKATFFVLGEIAQNRPEIVKLIANMGHEVGCHGFSHIETRKLGRKRFEKDVKLAIMAIQNAGGGTPIGFRAPWMSINKKTPWALNVLEKLGYKYDSSIFPAWTPWYGLRNAPTYPYRPSKIDPTKEDGTRNFMEFPPLVRNIMGIRCPAAGGFYLRFFGYKFIKASIEAMNQQGYPAVIFIHPWELHHIQSFPASKRFLVHGIPCVKSFERLIRSSIFGSAREVLKSMMVK